MLGDRWWMWYLCVWFVVGVKRWIGYDNYPHWSIFIVRQQGFIKWELIITALNMRKHTVDGRNLDLHHLRLVVYPIIYKVKNTSQVVVWDFFHPKVGKNIRWTWTAMSVYYIISILPSSWSWWSYQLRLPAILDFWLKNFTKYAECMEYWPGPKIWPLHKIYGNQSRWRFHTCSANMGKNQTPTYVALQRIQWECCRRRQEFSQVSA